MQKNHHRDINFLQETSTHTENDLRSGEKALQRYISYQTFFQAMHAFSLLSFLPPLDVSFDSASPVCSEKEKTAAACLVKEYRVTTNKSLKYEFDSCTP